MVLHCMIWYFILSILHSSAFFASSRGLCLARRLFPPSTHPTHLDHLAQPTHTNQFTLLVQPTHPAHLDHPAHPAQSTHPACYLLFDICHLSFVICHLIFFICHLFICYLLHCCLLHCLVYILLPYGITWYCIV